MAIFSSSPFAFGVIAKLITGCGNSSGGDSSRSSSATSRSPVITSFSFATAPMSPATKRRRGRVLLALEDEQLADSLLALRARVDEVRVGLDLAREDAEDVDPPANGSATVLKTNAAGPFAGDLELERFLRRRRDALDEQVEEPGRAEVLRGRAARDGEELVGDDGVLERGRELVARDLALLEVALHQRLVRLDDGVDELLAVLGRLRGDLLRDLDGIALALPPSGDM